VFIMPAKATKKRRDGFAGAALRNAKRESRKLTASDLHTEVADSGKRTEDLVQGILEPKVVSGETYQDDMFWNEQLSMRINKMQELHEKSKKVVLIDKRKKAEISEDKDQAYWFELSKKLPIPQRPKWSMDMSPKELQDNEKQDFLNWRRAMAQIEEDEQVFLTPFEKNLEVWRQLWRVIERSDVIFIILDARNPLMFRNVNLEEYIRTHKNVAGKSKQFILLLNKADLLSKKQRHAWANYFMKSGLRFIYFSAGMALKEVEEEKERLRSIATIEEALAIGDIDDEEADKLLEDLKPKKLATVELGADGNPVDRTHIFSRQDLIMYCELYCKFLGLHQKPEQTGPAFVPKKNAPKGYIPKGVVRPEKHGIVVGMVGYPNVGKSSTINALFSTKKVVVSATPGKTKHFQTLILNDLVTLCDCPGLVFPTFASTREGMICDGIIPVATMRDYFAPMDLLLARIKKEVIEMMYNVDIEWDHDQDHASSFTELVLNIFARHRGTMTDHDKPNQSRAARELLRDYVAGKLVYVHPPPKDPNADPDEELQAWQELEEDAEAEDEEFETDEEEEDGEGGQEAGEVHDDDLDEAAALRHPHDDDDDDDDDEEEPEINLPVDHPPNPTFDRRAEAFNTDNINMQEIYAKMTQKKKKAHRGQNSRVERTPLETEDFSGLLSMEKDGTCVVALDEEDGVVQIDVPVDKKTKQPTKRQLRQEQKAKEKSMTFASARHVAVAGYKAVAEQSHTYIH